MDIGTAVVTLVVAALALLPRVQSFTADGRRQSRIQRDIGLWTAMPKGKVRDQLGATIESDTEALLTARGLDKSINEAWLEGSIWMVIGWLVVGAGLTIEPTGLWLLSARSALIATGGVWFALGAAAVLRAAWRDVRGWLAARRGENAP